MTTSSLDPSFTVCAACGLPFRARAAVCPSCGSVAPIERTIARLSGWARGVGRDRTMRVRAMLWAMAACPLLFLPPLAAIAIAWRRRADARRFDPTWITIVALINLAASTAIVARYGASVGDLIKAIEQPSSEPAASHHPAPLRSI